MSFVPNPELLSLLTSMGYTVELASRALERTGNNNAELAAGWICDHQDSDADSDEDPTAEGFLDESDFYKMVLVVNTGLNMGLGKVGAQTAHAALGLYKNLLDDQHRYGEMLLSWEQFGESKIVLKGKDAEELKAMSLKATSLGLANYLVQDAGRTQIPAGSITVLAIIGKNDIVDKVTGQLSLL